MSASFGISSRRASRAVVGVGGEGAAGGAATTGAGGVAITDVERAASLRACGVSVDAGSTTATVAGGRTINETVVSRPLPASTMIRTRPGLRADTMPVRRSTEATLASVLVNSMSAFAARPVEGSCTLQRSCSSSPGRSESETSGVSLSTGNATRARGAAGAVATSAVRAEAGGVTGRGADATERGAGGTASDAGALPGVADATDGATGREGTLVGFLTGAGGSAAGSGVDADGTNAGIGSSAGSAGTSIWTGAVVAAAVDAGWGEGVVAAADGSGTEAGGVLSMSSAGSPVVPVAYSRAGSSGSLADVR